MGPCFRRGDVDFATRKSARQYLSNGLILGRKADKRAINEGEKRGRTKRPRRGVECAECWVHTPVLFPDFHRRRLGFDHPAVPDAAVSNRGTRRRCRGAVERLAGTDAAGVAHYLRDDMWLPAVGGVRHSGRDADRGIEDGGELRLSAVWVLAIGPDDRDAPPVFRLFRLLHHPPCVIALPA